MSNVNNSGSVRLTSETTVRHFAEITINGQNKGKREINGTPTLKDFAKGLAKEFGLTSFNVVVDFGEGLAPVTTQSQADRPATDATKVGVTAKDSRASEAEPQTQAGAMTGEATGEDAQSAAEQGGEGEGEEVKA